MFVRARASNPCVIFFDELDALCPKRDSNGKGDGGVSERVVNQLLTEMDGLENRGDISFFFFFFFLSFFFFFLSFFIVFLSFFIVFL